jgi:ubiquinone/menaquinone biosynthesis C-methylase UbiE
MFQETKSKMANNIEPSRAQAQVGTATSLPFDDDSADALLLFVPLYHLVQSEERRMALEEAFRVMKPGAYLFAAGISRFASLY